MEDEGPEGEAGEHGPRGQAAECEELDDTVRGIVNGISDKECCQDPNRREEEKQDPKVIEQSKRISCNSSAEVKKASIVIGQFAWDT